jgi:hypothetical protein
MTHATPSRVPEHIAMNARLIAVTRGTAAAAEFLRMQGIPIKAAKQILATDRRARS